MTAISRLQLFEFGDQAWMYGRVREAYMDCLNLVHRIFLPYRALAKPFAKWCAGLKAAEVLDLASGGGAHLLPLFREAAAAKLKLHPLVLSDRAPQAALYAQACGKAPAGSLSYADQPVDISQIERYPFRAYSIFSAFHHLEPAQAQALIAKCLANGEGIFIGEFFHRRFFDLAVMFSGPLFFLFAPFVSGRFNWAKALLCTLLPIVPMMVCWDALVSVVRTYTGEEIMAMVPEEQRSRFVFEYGRVRYGFYHEAVYFSARPRTA